MPIIFDVGANDGKTLLSLADDPNNIIYAFEPTPFLIEKLKKQTANFPNYHIIEKAVSNYNGKAKFNISGNADWGCSSLCNFNTNLNEKWPGRTDFKVTDTIFVDVIRLDKFVEENNISCIDHFHCDVQGQDLEVLMGLSSKISIIKYGVIEMPTSHDSKLYKNQKYIHIDAINYLKSYNFNILKVESNDCFDHEVNIYFSS